MMFDAGLCAGEDEDQFEQFMLPLTAAFETVAQMLSTNTFNEQEAKVTRTRTPYRLNSAKRCTNGACIFRLLRKGFWMLKFSQHSPSGPTWSCALGLPVTTTCGCVVPPLCRGLWWVWCET